MPQYSPDGKKVAFFENRASLKIIDLKSKAVTTATDGKDLYSYSDGDIWFSWSPDSRWLLAPYMGNAGWNNTDISLIDATGKKAPFNLTQSGYNDGGGKWVLKGKAMLFFSDRAGYRSHGSWGAESDAYLMFFDLDAYDRSACRKKNENCSTRLKKSRKKDDKDAKDKSEKKDKKDDKK